MLRDNDEFETQYDCPTCRRTFLTGSKNLLLTDGITESLAGRAVILRLPPLSERKVRGECPV